MTDRRTIRLATRPSPLARRQADLAASALRRADLELTVEIVAIRSEADVRAAVPLRQFGDRAAFVARVEQAVLAGEADVAVHSLKDVPIDPSPGLRLAAFLPREDPRDVLVSGGPGLHELPHEARVATGSPRRVAQLRHARPDLTFTGIRGNVDTRLAKLESGAVDALVLAAAGLNRLERADVITEYLDPHMCTPAPGQGIVVLQCRQDDALEGLIDKASDGDASRAAAVERGLGQAVGAGCSTPFGALATISGDDLTLVAALERPDGSLRRCVEIGETARWEEVVARAARSLTD